MDQVAEYITLAATDFQAKAEEIRAGVAGLGPLHPPAVEVDGELGLEEGELLFDAAHILILHVDLELGQEGENLLLEGADVAAIGVVDGWCWPSTRRSAPGADLCQQGETDWEGREAGGMPKELMGNAASFLGVFLLALGP